MRDMAIVATSFAIVCGFAIKTIKNQPMSISEGLALNWDDTPSTLTKRCEFELDKIANTIDSIATTDQPTFTNVVQRFERETSAFSEVIDPLVFYASVAPSKDLRAASDACSKKISKLFIDIFSRKDLFKAFSYVFKNKHLITDPLDLKLLEEYHQDFILNGMNLDREQQQEFANLTKTLVDLSSAFRNTLNDWREPLYLTRNELRGLPKSFIDGLDKKDGKFILTLQYPHYYAFMKNGADEAVRKKLQLAFMTRGGPENKSRLRKAIEIRARKAKLLGYESHAHLRLAERMAQNPENVRTFLQDIRKGLSKKGHQELQQLTALKQREAKSNAPAKINLWDWRYYATQLVKEKYDVDPLQVKEYFPLEKVIAGMFAVYQNLLGVKFNEIKNAPVWHESVRKFAVFDPKLKTDVAYFYMDLFPRQGKYGHAAAFTLISGRKLPDGKYRRPVSSIVVNFPAPTAKEPSLLTHDQVETMFHEFGHVMHQILTQAKYSYFSGTSVKRDFVEAPSQMLENWVWRKEVLDKISSHYQTQRPLPDELLQKMLRAKNATSGIFYLRQLFFATLDLDYHTTTDFSDFDTSTTYHQLMKDIMLIDAPAGSYPEASFGHLMGGYDAGYYGYLWSEVYAQDMFTKFDSMGVLSKKAGHDYRKWILEPGGSVDPFTLIEGFLERKPNSEAFLKDIGLN